MQLVIASKLKHGDIVKTMNERGWNGKRTAEFLGISLQSFYMIVNLKWIPKKVSAELELNLLDLTGKTLKELFPEEILTPDFIKLDKRAEVFIDAQLALSGRFPFFQLPPTPEEAFCRNNLPVAFAKAFQDAKLTPSQQQVIYMRFFQDMTLEKVGKIIGVNRERVRQIEMKALRKLRHPRAARALEGYAEVLGI